MSQMASNYEYEEDEPMDIDTSSIKTPMKGPSTPAIFNKEDKINKLEEQSSSSMNRNQAKITQPSGAKIVKAIRPGIIPNKSVIKPPVQQQTPIGLYDDGYEMIDDPFKTRTRIGFDGSATSSSSSISADTVGSSTSSSNVAVVAKCVEEEAEEERQNDEDGIISVDTKTVEVMPPPPMPSQQISPPTSSSSSSGNTDTSSVGSLSPSQQPQPVLANSDSNHISSNNFENEMKPRLDSLEDGEEEEESNHVETVSSTISARGDVEQEQEPEQEQFSSNYNFDADDANMMMEEELNSSNTRTPTNQVFKVTSRHHHNHHVSFDSKPPQVESFDDFDPLKQQSTANVQIMVNDQSVNNIFESIFTNETDFQSFLDVLEKKEINRPEKEPKYSDIARKSLFLPFDLLLQNKNLTPDNYRRLSVIKEKQAEIKSYLTTKTPTSNGNNETTETPKVVGKLEQHLEEQEEEQVEQEKTETVTEVIEVTEEQQPNDQLNDTASAFAQQQQLNNSIFFDSIFSNDQEFQMFLDVLEKKEVNEESSALRKSPNKYSEFARKSLYILFDPIVEKDKSITPDKAQRLNHLREKQDVIKAYLSEIAEESGENVTSNITTTTTATTRTNEPETTTNQTTKDDYFKDDKVDELTTNKSALNQHREQQNTSIRLAETSNNKTGKMEDGADEAAAANATVVDDQEESDERFNDDLIVAAAVSSSKRESSISSSHSFDTATSNPNAHLATPQSNPPSNNSILDLDKITLKSPIDASTNKLLSVDDLETPITKKDDIMTSSTTTSSLEANANALKARMKSIKSQNLERKQQQLMTSSQIGALADDELTTSTTTPVTSAADQALIGKLQAELQAYKDRERNYLDHIGQIEEENEKFQHIAVEFEQIFHQLVKDKDANENKLRQEIIELTKERDHLQEDVVGIERSFDDLHRRFENLKTKVVEFRKNEENLQKAIESYQQQLEKEKLKYSTLKKHAEEKLESANVEIDKLRKSTGFELQALKAELKRAEIKIGSLELSVQQKDQENSQLTSLLEELLNKVKPNN